MRLSFGAFPVARLPNTKGALVTPRIRLVVTNYFRHVSGQARVVTAGQTRVSFAGQDFYLGKTSTWARTVRQRAWHVLTACWLNMPKLANGQTSQLAWSRRRFGCVILLPITVREFFPDTVANQRPHATALSICWTCSMICTAAMQHRHSVLVSWTPCGTNFGRLGFAAGRSTSRCVT